MSPEKHSAPSERLKPYESPNTIDQDFDLLEIISQLWKGKLIIFASMITMLIIGAIYVMTVKEKWISESIITQPSAGQVSTYNNALSILYIQNIDDKIRLPDLQRQIFNRYTASAYALSGTLGSLENPEEFKVRQATKGKDDPLILTFTGDSAKDAQTRLTHYISELNREVSNDYALDMRTNIFVKLNGLKDSLAAQEKIAQDKKQHRLDVIAQAIKVADAAKINATQLSQAEFLSDDTLYLLGGPALKSMIANENTKPLELSDYYYETQRAYFSLKNLRIDFSKLQNFQYIKKADLPIRRNSPKRALTLAFALVFGAIIGSCIVISRNVTRSYRLRNQK
ncbi:LPS O-antigen chain length determinant protein WzzB [Erwinia sp. MMLR14_017]|uniref:LPS O-antigen chain length determinant protein WzzB n=1 Tax=Erwinia sp. MMLR14_017 TaxID=3093842 RepID=UPI0029902D9E|nr:LPS O-antigen chain length determinant protein WzzB [Erwinia sp. MMLR14_017]MDW8847220.1 LPS O-antigen chain length determinant protein WzzB [Erwinia sp. MMLR14_017]